MAGAAQEHTHVESGLCECGGVALNGTNFPDPAFREYIVTDCDWNIDGFLSAEEIAGIERIEIYTNNNISSLKGVEHFTALKQLIIKDNPITELDLSANTALENLDCPSNALTTLKLNSAVLTYIYCVNNDLTELDLSKCTGLLTLYCGGNKLANLDLSNNTALTNLDCSNNGLTSLDLRANTALATLYCSDNYIMCMDLSANKSIETFSGVSDWINISVEPDNPTYIMPDGFDPTKVILAEGLSFSGNVMTVAVDYDGYYYRYTYNVGLGLDKELTVNFNVHVHEYATGNVAKDKTHHYTQFCTVCKMGIEETVELHNFANSVCDCGYYACTHNGINPNDGICYNCEKQFAVSVIGNGIYYFDSFAEALAKAKELFEANGLRNTIKLYTDLTVSEPVTFAGSELGLALNGKTLTFTSNGGACWTIDNAIVYISDTNGGKIYFNMGDVAGDGGIVLTNGATLAINNGTFETSVGPAFYIVKGAITQNGGVVKNHIKIQEGDYTLVGGEINVAEEMAFIIDSNGGVYKNKITISGGAVYANDLLRKNTTDTAVEITISGGTLTGKENCFYIPLAENDSALISGGTFGNGLLVDGTLRAILAPCYAFHDANGEPIELTEGQNSIIIAYVTVGACNHSDPSYIIEDDFSQKHIVLCIVCGFKEEAACIYQSDCEEWCSVCFFMTRDIPIEMHSLNYIVTDSIPTGQHRITCENCKFSEIANCTYAQDCSEACIYCGRANPAPAEHTPAYTNNGNGTHEVTCSVCAHVIAEDVLCSDNDADNNAVCDLCGVITYTGAGTEADPYVVTTAAELKAALNSTANETNYIVLGERIPYTSGFGAIDISSDKKPFVLDLNTYPLNMTLYINVDATIKNGTFNQMVSVKGDIKVYFENITTEFQVSSGGNSILTVRNSALSLLSSNDSSKIIADNVTLSLSDELGYIYLYKCNGGSLILDGVEYTESITDIHYPHPGEKVYTSYTDEAGNKNGTHKVTLTCCDKVIAETENCTPADCTAESECVCGHTMAATQTAHDFSGEYTYNESGHWKKCKNCEAKAEETWHGIHGNFDCEQDKLCICGYVIEKAKGHDFSYFTGDNTHHYTACWSCLKPLESTKVPHNLTGNKGYSEEYHYDICDGCEVEINKEKHTLTHYENTEKHWSECSVCQGTVGEYDHYFEAKSDETHHWYECDGEYCTATKGYAEHNANGGLYCEVCSKTLLYGKVSQVSLTLDGDIGVNFYWFLSIEVLESNDAYFLITLPNGETEKVAVSYDLVASPVNVNDGKTYFKVTGRVAAKEMAEKIKVELYFGGVSVASGECSVRDYAQLVFDNDPNNEKLVSMMKAMLNYGAASQMLFGHNEGDLANKNLAEDDRVVSEVSATLNPVLVSGSVSGIKTEEFSVILETKTTIRHYFSLTDGAKIEGYSFTIDGVSVTPTEIVRNGKTMYYVDITDISAKDMENLYIFTISCDEEQTIITASVHSYINAVIKNQDNTALVSKELLDTVYAMHAYGEAAKTYFATLNG